MYAFNSTGYYVTPGETIQVYVEADDNGVMPQLVFGQVGKGKSDWRRWFDLKPGLNTITAQTSDKMNPAAIYISNQALPEDQAYAPRIRIEGGTKFPYYVHGETDPVAFEKELREYVKNVSYNDDDFANGNPNEYYYNIADTMDGWEEMYDFYAKYSGYDTEDESSDNYMSRGKFTCHVFSKDPFSMS